MESRHLLIEMLRQHRHGLPVLRRVGPEFHLRQHLVGEGRAHHEARMAGGDTQIHQPPFGRSEEHTSELQSLMRISYAVFCLKKKTLYNPTINSSLYIWTYTSTTTIYTTLTTTQVV